MASCLRRFSRAIPRRSGLPEQRPETRGGSSGRSPGWVDGILPQPDAYSSFQAEEQEFAPATVQVALQPINSDRVIVFGGDAPSSSWGTIVLPALVAILRERGSRGLLPQEQAEATNAIEGSDGASAAALYSALERVAGGASGASRQLQSLLRASGDTQTIVPDAGYATVIKTAWAPSASTAMMASLASGCLATRGQADSVLALMRNVQVANRWGLGTGGFKSPVALLGGYASTSGGTRTVRQIGLLGSGPSAIAVSMVAHPGPGDDLFGGGSAVLTATAQWLNRELVFGSGSPPECSKNS